MLKKGSKLYSVLHNKCPRCQEGEFFRSSASPTFKNNLKIYEKCSSCGLKYMIEPSFFYGAMYINYGITVAISVAVFVIAKLGFELDLLQSFLMVLAALIVLAPINLRLARILWINMFVNFKEETEIEKLKE